MKTSGGVTTFYQYDLDGKLIAESAATSGYAYIYRGSNLLAKTNEDTGEIWFYHNDGIGTPNYMTNADNEVVWEGIYRKPFGQIEVNPKSQVENNMRFQGQYYDAETGLHYNWHRYYDPETGRYLTPEPIGLAGGINPYLYVAGDPVNMVDIDGKTDRKSSNYERYHCESVLKKSTIRSDYYPLSIM